MYFGLLNTDIVNSFSQATSADFAVGAVDGYTIIAKEMEFQYEKLMGVLPQEVIQMMDRINNEVALVNVSGGFVPTFYAIPATLRGYIVSKGYSPCPGQTLESIEMCWQNTGNQLFVNPANITSSGNNQYVLNDVFDAKTQNLVIYYDVDAENLEITSLKSLLRDMVCYSLGSRIYPVSTGEGTWSIVSYYGEEATKWLKYYEDGNLPLEFKKIRIMNKKSGITSIKLVRS